MYGESFLPDYELVYTTGAGGYEWAELRVYKKKSDGRLFYAGASGCSCYSYEDEVEESDLIQLQSLAGAQRAVKEFLDEKEWYFGSSPVSEYADAIEALRGLGLR